VLVRSPDAWGGSPDVWGGSPDVWGGSPDVWGGSPDLPHAFQLAEERTAGTSGQIRVP